MFLGRFRLSWIIISSKNQIGNPDLISSKSLNCVRSDVKRSIKDEFIAINYKIIVGSEPIEVSSYDTYNYTILNAEFKKNLVTSPKFFD